MERLISADRLLKWMRKAEEALATDKICCSNMIWMIEQSPTVDAEPVRHGKWKDIREKSLYIPDERTTIEITSQTCSECGYRVSFKGAIPYIKDRYCPNCNAKMDGK